MTITQLPIVPTGHQKCALPDRPDWVTAFWIACYHKVKEEAKRGLLVISHQRFARKESLQQEDEEEMEPHERPIVTNRYTQQQIPSLIGTRSTGSKILTVAGASAGGAGIGALIGIVGGPPGAAIGGGIGAAVGFIGGNIYNYFRN